MKVTEIWDNIKDDEHIRTQNKIWANIPSMCYLFKKKWTPVNIFKSDGHEDS